MELMVEKDGQDEDDGAFEVEEDFWFGEHWKKRSTLIGPSGSHGN